MAAINLLPTELTVKSSTAKTSQAIKNISLVGLVIVVLSALGFISFFVFTSFQMRNSNDRQTQLITSIKSLEQTEQKLVLVKDRLENVKKVIAKDNALDGVSDLSVFYSQMPIDVSIREAQITPNKMELSLVARSSSGLTKIFSAILSDKTYKKIKLTSFAFNANVGYVASLTLSK